VNEPPKWAKSGILQAAQVLGSNSPDDPIAHFSGYVAAATRPLADIGEVAVYCPECAEREFDDSRGR
jgi:hypothetical protein